MSLLLFLSGFSVSSCAAWVRKLTERTKWHQFFPHWILFQVVETAVCMDLHKHHSFKLTETETIQWLRTPADQYDVWVTVCACDFPLLCYTRNTCQHHILLYEIFLTPYDILLGLFRMCIELKRIVSHWVCFMTVYVKERWKHKETGGIKDRTTTTYLRGRVLNLQELMWYNFLLLQPTVIHTMTCTCSYGGKNTC